MRLTPSSYIYTHMYIYMAAGGARGLHQADEPGGEGAGGGQRGAHQRHPPVRGRGYVFAYKNNTRSDMFFLFFYIFYIFNGWLYVYMCRP